jgi:hypothetical protein
VPARRDGDAAAITVGGVEQRVPAAVADGADAGAAWLAVLRPEQLALAPAGEPGAWPGRVAARRFAGGTSVYEVAAAGPPGGGGDVRLEIATPARDAREGDAVTVRLARGPVALVPADR